MPVSAAGAGGCRGRGPVSFICTRRRPCQGRGAGVGRSPRSRGAAALSLLFVLRYFDPKRTPNPTEVEALGRGGAGVRARASRPLAPRSRGSLLCPQPVSFTQLRRVPHTRQAPFQVVLACSPAPSSQRLRKANVVPARRRETEPQRCRVLGPGSQSLRVGGAGFESALGGRPLLPAPVHPRGLRCQPVCARNQAGGQLSSPCPLWSCGQCSGNETQQN